MVYAYILPSAETLQWSSLNFIRLNISSDGNIKPRKKAELGILRTCHQINDETAHHLYGVPEFSLFSHRNVMYGEGTWPGHYWLQLIGKENRLKVKRLKIVVETSGQPDGGLFRRVAFYWFPNVRKNLREMLDLLCDCHSLRSLDFDLGSKQTYLYFFLQYFSPTSAIMSKLEKSVDLQSFTISPAPTGEKDKQKVKELKVMLMSPEGRLKELSQEMASLKAERARLNSRMMEVMQEIDDIAGTGRNVGGTRHGG